MTFDQPLCSMSYCKYYFDGNCSASNRWREHCDLLKAVGNFDEANRCLAAATDDIKTMLNTHVDDGHYLCAFCQKSQTVNGAEACPYYDQDSCNGYALWRGAPVQNGN